MLLLSLFTSFPFSASMVDMDKKLVTIRQEMTELNKNRDCKVNEDCELLAYGHAQCGGIGAYLVVAKHNKDRDVLSARAAEYTKLEVEYQRKFLKAVSGICVETPAPQFGCLGGVCREKIGKLEPGLEPPPAPPPAKKK